MVTQRTIEIVKATAPVIREKGEEITKRMYQLAFEERPEYRRGFETTWMQDPNGNGQAHKLAAAVYAYFTDRYPWSEIGLPRLEPHRRHLVPLPFKLELEKPFDAGTEMPT